MIDNEEETAKAILTSISQSLCGIDGSLESIAESLDALVEMFREASFTFNGGKARAFRNSNIE